VETTFRWFGADDPVPLEHIRQVPGVEGVVSALYHVPPGEVWPKDELAGLGERIAAAGLRFSVAESIPVHEEIKLGGAGRDRLIDAYCRSVRHLGELGVGVLCYNFMPVFDWTRTELEMRLADGSAALAYDHRVLAAIDLSTAPAACRGGPRRTTACSWPACARPTGGSTTSGCGRTSPTSWSASSRWPTRRG
jgi:mannonate dehydratase